MNKNIAYGHGHSFRDCGIKQNYISVTCKANEVTTVDVVYDEPFDEITDAVFVSALTSAPYTTVRGCSASGYTKEGFKLHVYRTSAGNAGVLWMAIGK